MVDDDPDLLQLMQWILEPAGYRVETAANGREALERLDAALPELPALVLLDMKMPVMSGADFLREFERRHGRAAPVVLVTAADDAGHRASEVRADGWLAKPFDPDALVETVRRYAAAG